MVSDVQMPEVDGFTLVQQIRQEPPLASAGAFCWGDNGAGQLGDGTVTDRVMPVAVTSP